MTDYTIRVLNGLPAIARVHNFLPTVPATWHHPEEGGEVEWELLDSRGKPAEWLEKRMTDQERQRIDQEVYERCADDYSKRFYDN